MSVPTSAFEHECFGGGMLFNMFLRDKYGKVQIFIFYVYSLFSYCNTEMQKPALEKKQFVPPAKLWIVDCLRMPQHPSKSNSFIFCNRTIKHVDIMGVITGTRRMGCSRLAYQVDDGTGTIACLYDSEKPNLYSLQSETEIMKDWLHKEGILGSYNSEEKKCLDELLRPTTQVVNTLLEERTLGDTVQISGQLSEFRDIREVKVYTMRLVTDLNDEISRIQETIILYEQGYLSEK